MEQTAEEAHEARRRRAIDQLASVVMVLAEERHETKQHAGDFRKCTHATCADAREAYMAL
jgi:hypothetical protein